MTDIKAMLDDCIARLSKRFPGVRVQAHYSASNDSPNIERHPWWVSLGTIHHPHSGIGHSLSEAETSAVIEHEKLSGDELRKMQLDAERMGLKLVPKEAA